MRKTWLSYKYILFAVLLVVVTSLVVVAYYINHPRAELLADTWSYLYVVNLLQAHGQLVNYWRLPGYPLFIAGVYALFGSGNIEAVSIVQAIFFVITTLEVYVIAALIMRRAWIALLIGLLVGTNLVLLSYVKPLMSESLGFFLVVTLALAIVIFLQTLCRRVLWLVALCSWLLFFTRPEWMYLPVPLFAYLLFSSVKRGMFMRILPHAVVSLVILYTFVGGYVYINAVQNHFVGVTWIQNINELGKVIQYRMQNETTPQYASVSHILDTHIAAHMSDPYFILAREPSLTENYASLSGTFAQSVILNHPVGFVRRTLPLFISYPLAYYQESSIASAGLFAHALSFLLEMYHKLYTVNVVLPLFVVIWICLLCRRSTRSLPSVLAMGAILLLVLYGIVSTTFGTYRAYDYMRIQVLFDPLLSLIIYGTCLWGIALLYKRLFRRPVGVAPETAEPDVDENEYAHI
jgi:hypothetical protein